MINLHERMLPTSAGVEPATSWSPVGRRIQLSHRGMFVPNFKILGDVVPVKSLTKKSLHRQTHTHTEKHIVMEKMKTIYPLHTSYAGA